MINNVNPVYVQGTAMKQPIKAPVPEAYAGEVETLKKLLDTYMAPYKNNPGKMVTTSLDMQGADNLRKLVVAAEDRLAELGVK